MRKRPFSSFPLAVMLLASCQHPHVCGASCEAGLVPGLTFEEAADEPGSTLEQVTEQATPKAAEGETQKGEASAEYLKAFDEAWQTIHDTHFDKDFNGIDWQAVRTELRPRAERAKSREEVRELIGEMVGRLGQSHFAVIPSSALPAASGGSHDQSGGLGFDVRLRDGRLLVVSLEPDGAAEAAGVKTGWSVRRIGSFDVAGELERLSQAAAELGARRLGATLWMTASAYITGTVGGRESVQLENGERQAVELELERRARDVTAFEVSSSLPTFYLAFSSRDLERESRRIGYIGFSNWFLPIMQRLDAAVDHMRAFDGIVIDLRGNTGGAAAMTMGISGHFFGESRKLGTMITRDSTLNILAFPRKVNAAGDLVEPFSGPLAILVDETTGSASEVFAGGMQSLGRARIFGETSVGAVLPAMTTRLPNGDTLLHAMGDFETSTGDRLEGVGVVPDELAPLTRTDLLEGRDAPLEAALDWILSETKP